jgi:hypothetical protein
MKNIVIILIITTLTIFMAAVVVSADGNRSGRFHGVYEMSLMSSCLHSMLGFNETEPPFTPIAGSEVWGATAMAQGAWTFYPDGTGDAEGNNYVIDFPPGPPSQVIFPAGPMARGNPFGFEFTYDVTAKGAITVTRDNGLVMEGAVSDNRKAMTLPSMYLFYDLSAYGLGYAVCNTARNLIRVKKR